MIPPHRYGVRTASLLVVASMVGTGVFTTSGLLLAQLGSIGAVLLVWIAGGVVALAGALSYAELAAHAPESGGEYALLARTFHPAVGFCAGVVSIIAGFAAPIAACAIAFAHYLAAIVPELPETLVAILIVIVASTIHALHLRAGARFQDAMTIAKLALIALFTIAGALRADLSRLLEPLEPSAIATPSFAIGLVLVYFAYTGWNAAAYIAGEVDRPSRTLPLALLLGTLGVTALYVALNAVFLAAAPPSELAGRIEVGAIAAQHLFGPMAARVLSAVIALGLVSTIGAFVVTGTRVYDAMGRDHARLSFLARRTAGGAPIVAIAIQAALAIAMVLTASFEVLLGAVGFTLSIASGLTVVGLLIERRRHPARPLPYRVPLYPVTPLFFVGVMAWTVVQSILHVREIAWIGLAIIALGLVGFFVLTARTRAKTA
ncbi:MAG: amino acid permease [Myxococcota bacterium]|nr:amino acid permease [Myxococcota bacterium]